ncbi:hypothetical protein [Poriferisphaera sp. WC338]|uniref:hypothetical protein n=1 Tax=Poriferisphaera sp. WC338 TaxID=3425129 RepID=UPI003D818CAA
MSCDKSRVVFSSNIRGRRITRDKSYLFGLESEHDVEDQAIRYETVSISTGEEDAEEQLGYRLLSGEFEGAVFVIHDVEIEEAAEGDEDDEPSMVINFDVVDGVVLEEDGSVPGELEELIAAVACDLMDREIDGED